MSQKTGANSGRFYGKYRGVVTNIKDPNYMGRIKFSCPDVFGSNDVESAWALPCNACAYEGGGDIALPNIGETVWVEFEQGNANKPIWVGNFWTKESTPFGSGKTAKSGVTEEDYGNQSRVISYKGCTVVMKDGVVNLSNGKCSINMSANSASVSGNLTVSGNLIVKGTAKISKTATCGSLKASSIFATTAVDSEGEIIAGSGCIEAEKDITVTENLHVLMDTDITGKLDVTDDVTMAGKLGVTGDTTLQKLNVKDVNATKCSLV